MSYGPERSEPSTSYNDYRTPGYLSGYIRKLKYDIVKKFRLYEGKRAYLFKVDKSSTRCTECTDTITGDITISNCSVCDGTGYLSSYQYDDTYWIKIEISPEQDITGDFGNTENAGARRDLITLVDATLVKDKDLIVLVDTGDIYKVLDFEAQIAAISGSVITQTVQCSFLTRGSNEYSIVEELVLSLSGSGSGSG